MTCRFIVVLCLLFTTTASASDAVPVGALDGKVVDRVEIHGAHKIDAETVRFHLGTVAGRVFDAAQVRADIREIWKLGVFADVDVETLVTDAGGVRVAFEVTERPMLRKVLIAGNHDLSLDKINDVLDLRKDEVLDIGAARRNKVKIAELLETSGFMLGTVEMEVVPVGKGDEVDVRYTLDEHAKVRVADVEFVGNHAISSDELRDHLMTRPAGRLSFIMGPDGVYRREALERDVAMLSALYLDRGYANIKIGAPSLQLSRDKKKMHVSIPVDEGPRFTFGEITFAGDLLGSLADHQKIVKAKPGATFVRSQIVRDREVLETHYRDLGYALASVAPKPRVDNVAHVISVAYEVVRGKRAYVERIHVRGNSKTRDRVIRRELKISEGDLFSGTAVERSRARIFALGYFDNVTISTARGSSDEFVDLNVEVVERPTGTFQIGAGFSSRESFILQGQVQYNNFLGRGESVALQAQISGLRRLFMFRFVEPYFLDTKWMFSTELYNDSRGFGNFTRNATGGALTWGYQLTDHTSASLTYRLENIGLSGVSGGFAQIGARTTELPTVDTTNLLRGGWSSSVRAAIAYDTRDNRLLPTGGWHAQAYAEYAGTLTASENKYVRWGGFLRHYQRLGGSPFVLRLNGELGVTTSLDGRGVPLTERYLLGGIYDIRGYQARSIGPQLYAMRPGDVGQALDPVSLGGNVSIVTNAEVEFPLAKKLGLSGVVFFDAGNAYNLEEKYCKAGVTAEDACTTNFLGNLRTSVGAGVRWLSPIGPLRLEWGIPLDLRKGEKPAGIEFTIGTSF